MLSINKFIQYLSPELLACLLTTNHIQLSSAPDFSDLKDNFICWLYQRAKKKELARLARDCERINTMTDDLGYQALLYVGQKPSDAVNDYPINRHNLAATLYIQQPKVFQQAEEIRYANHSREGQTWASFQVDGQPPFDNENNQVPFKEALQHYFRTNDAFYIDCFPLCASWNTETIQWLIKIYRGGVWRPFIEVADGGDSVRAKHYKPAWEYLIVYTPTTGVIEVVSKHQGERRELARLFATHYLEASMPISDIVPYYGCLRPFYQQPALPFFLDKPVEQDILWVCVSGGGLHSPHTGLRTRFLCSLKRLPEQDFYRTMDGHGLLPLLKNEKLYLSSVRLSICFAPSRTGDLPGETISFTISLPNRCTLKPHGIRHRYIRDILFPRWGVITG